MKKERLYELSNQIMAEMQSITRKDASKNELMYLMAYNDGVLDFMKVLIDEIDDEISKTILDNLAKENCEVAK